MNHNNNNNNKTHSRSSSSSSLDQIISRTNSSDSDGYDSINNDSCNNQNVIDINNCYCNVSVYEILSSTIIGFIIFIRNLWLLIQKSSTSGITRRRLIQLSTTTTTITKPHKRLLELCNDIVQQKQRLNDNNNSIDTQSSCKISIPEVILFTIIGFVIFVRSSSILVKWYKINKKNKEKDDSYNTTTTYSNKNKAYNLNDNTSTKKNKPYHHHQYQPNRSYNASWVPLSTNDDNDGDIELGIYNSNNNNNNNNNKSSSWWWKTPKAIRYLSETNTLQQQQQNEEREEDNDSNSDDYNSDDTTTISSTPLRSVVVKAKEWIHKDQKLYDFIDETKKQKDKLKSVQDPDLIRKEKRNSLKYRQTHIRQGPLGLSQRILQDKRSSLSETGKLDDYIAKEMKKNEITNEKM